MMLVRSHEERRCSILGPTQSRISPSRLSYTKRSLTSGAASERRRGGALYKELPPGGNMARIRQSRPDSGLGFKANVLKPFHVVHFSLDIEMAGSLTSGAEAGPPNHHDDKVDSDQ